VVEVANHCIDPKTDRQRHCLGCLVAQLACVHQRVNGFAQRKRLVAPAQRGPCAKRGREDM
jgi:hypothetical protein